MMSGINSTPDPRCGPRALSVRTIAIGCSPSLIVFQIPLYYGVRLIAAAKETLPASLSSGVNKLYRRK